MFDLIHTTKTGLSRIAVGFAFHTGSHKGMIHSAPCLYIDLLFICVSIRFRKMHLEGECPLELVDAPN